MSYAASIGILLSLVLGVIVLYASFAAVLLRLRILYYRKKYPDLLLETLIPTDMWDVVRVADAHCIVLLNWGKSETLNLSDVLGYKVKLQRIIRFSTNSSRGNSENFNGTVELETKNRGVLTLYIGDGDTATELGSSLKSIGIPFLDQSIETISNI